MSRARGPVCGPWPCLLVLAAFAAAPSEALAAPKHAAPGTQIAQAKQVKKTASPARPEHKAAAPVDAKKVEAKPTEAKSTEARKPKRVAERHHKKSSADDKQAENDAPQLTGDLAILKDVID